MARRTRLSRSWAPAALVLAPSACSELESPSLLGLSLGMSYDEVVEITGGHGDHLHDRGVRVLVWAYPDGSAIESGIHDGLISGLNVDAAGLGAEAQAWRASRSGLRSDITEWELRALFEPPAVLLEDSSDRECRWTWPDGSLGATFRRGRLERAGWTATDSGETEILVAPRDRVDVLFPLLKSERRSDRFRALQELRGLDDWRIADEVLALLERETDSANRVQAALVLADLGDERASDLLLPDLRRSIIPDQLLEAIGRIGNHRAAEELLDAEARVGSLHTKGKVRSARAQILKRLEP